MSGGAATRCASAVAVAVLAVDQATKAIVRAAIERGEEVSVLPGIELVNTRNRGIAFGLFQDGGALLIVVAAVAMVGIVVFFALNAGRPRAWIPMGLLVGGAAGNLLDRLRDGSVTDFIDLPAWPAFNVADMAITFGVLAMLWLLEGPRGRDRPG